MPSDPQPALHDVVTGVANRDLLLDRIDQVLQRATRRAPVTAVVLFDLDDFDAINQRLGHAVGNDVLVTVANRLGEMVEANDSIGRLGGGEFVLLLDDMPDLATVIALTQRMLDALARPVVACGQTVELAATAGIAVCLDSGWHADPRAGALAVVDDARAALDAARRGGSGCLQVFNESMRPGHDDRLDLADQLASATERGEIEVFYQPLIWLESGVVEGFEALARWRHPTRGLISPVTFIPIAEETEAIHEIGRLVLTNACMQVATWNTEYALELRISVNVSPAQLVRDSFETDVREALGSSGLAPHQLTLELTENVPVHDFARIGRRLQVLRGLGLRVALDDFGTGYASIAYLRSLPLQTLKIDKSFLYDEGVAGVALLAGMAALGTTMGLDTVAEGIEVPEQLDRARAAGVTFGQGFLIARPMSAERATQFVVDYTAGAWS
jgi:diguanylate cyclase (GGDEF)-like protein